MSLQEDFRDYKFASKAINTLKDLIQKPEPFLLSVGFKLPHLALHVPYQFYDLYKSRNESWKLTEHERTFPGNSPGERRTDQI